MGNPGSQYPQRPREVRTESSSTRLFPQGTGVAVPRGQWAQVTKKFQLYAALERGEGDQFTRIQKVSTATSPLCN